MVIGIGSGRSSWNGYRRHTYHVIDVGDRHTGGAVGPNVARVLAGKVGCDLVVEHLLDKVHVDGGKYMDRDRTFRLCLEHLKTKAAPQMIETGRIRSEDDWTAGFSTYIFGMALHGIGKLDSVDIDQTNVSFARNWTAGFDSVQVHKSDSLEWLRSYSELVIDVFYADCADVGTTDQIDRPNMMAGLVGQNSGQVKCVCVSGIRTRIFRYRLATRSSSPGGAPPGPVLARLT